MMEPLRSQANLIDSDFDKSTLGNQLTLRRGMRAEIRNAEGGKQRCGKRPAIRRDDGKLSVVMVFHHFFLEMIRTAMCIKNIDQTVNLCYHLCEIDYLVNFCEVTG